jgi:subtilisin family serine protease
LWGGGCPNDPRFHRIQTKLRGASAAKQDTNYYCGAAVAQMILDSIGSGLLDQNTLYNSNHNHNQRANNTGLNNDNIFPSTVPNELSDAIIEVVKGGAHIINLSLGLSTSSLTIYPTLQEAYNYARKHQVIIVAASGNHGNIGGISLIDNQWIIPVAACNESRLLDPTSNFGRSLGLRGLIAPGVNIRSTSAGGGYIQMSGTSFAVPFVTGGLALLLSIFPKASAADVVMSIRPSVSSSGHRKSIIPQLLDIESAYNNLKHLI